MTDEIPDDVLERAYKVYLAAHVYSDRNPLRAALRVFVEWEREQCARVAEKVQDSFLSEEYAIPQPLGSVQERFACGKVIAAIRARSRKD